MEKLDLIFNALEDVNAFDVIAYDTKKVSPFYDYLVIASVTSARQLQASVRHMTDDLGKIGDHDVRVEGKDSDSWILFDTKDIIVNVFTKEERLYYNIEKVLAGVPRVNQES